jgi:hypothetical protein
MSKGQWCVGSSYIYIEINEITEASAIKNTAAAEAD